MDRGYLWYPVISRDAIERVISSALRLNILDTLLEPRSISRARPGKRLRPRPLAHLLFEHWDALATNARNKISAIIGLASDSHLYNIYIDYRLSVCQVYTHFFRENIRLVRNLGIILLRRPQNPAHGLPFWCPGWSSTASESGDMLGDSYSFRTSGRLYNASAMDESGIDTELLSIFVLRKNHDGWWLEVRQGF